MTYTKKIVCLAKSWRTGGYCVAGKEVLEDGTFGSWIRPVSARPTMEINDAELTKKSGYKTGLGDMVEITFDKHVPQRHQVENHVITKDKPWVDRYKKTVAELAKAADKITGDLWHNGESSKHGKNDEVPERKINGIKSSLYLIQVPDLQIAISHEKRDEGHTARIFRGTFKLNGTTYTMRITDPSMNWRIKDPKAKKCEYKDPLLCVSLSDVFEDTGYAHKLIAAVIADDM